MDEKVKEYLKEIGRRGGQTTLKRHGPEHMSAIRGSKPTRKKKPPIKKAENQSVKWVIE